MADIGVTVDRPAFEIAVSVTPPPSVNVGVEIFRAASQASVTAQLFRPEVSVEVTRVDGGAEPDLDFTLIYNTAKL